jgi:hypothetical protein
MLLCCTMPRCEETAVPSEWPQTTSLEPVPILVRVQLYTACIAKANIGDPDPDIFGPPGSGSISQRYGSGSFPFLIRSEKMLAK